MSYFRFEVYVPVTHVDKVKEALAKGKAGQIGNYDSCMWMTKGEGQFRPLKDSNPYIGKLNEIEKVEEYKIECIVEKKYINDVIKEMKKSHPYETPSYQYLPVYIDEYKEN